jgi:hypothetical protein
LIPIFIGWDPRETVAYHVLAHSLIRHSSQSLAITPVGSDVLAPELWWRPRGNHDSTAFSNARFAVPALMNYRGWALFMDCDMLATHDIAALWAQRDPAKAVLVRKHEYHPEKATKFLGAKQSKYPRKNWSSLMLINCSHPAAQSLTPRYINSAEGLALHGFEWCGPDDIGAIKGPWNELAPEDHTPQGIGLDGHLIHYTLGGPWHGERPVGSQAWTWELLHLLAGGNPAGAASAASMAGATDVHVSYAPLDPA